MCGRTVLIIWNDNENDNENNYIKHKDSLQFLQYKIMNKKKYAMLDFMSGDQTGKRRIR